MRKVLIFLLLIISLPVFSQQLEMTIQNQPYMVECEPNQRWLITKENNQFNIYTENFDLVSSFNLGAHQNYVQYIYQVARDLDDDDNIEVLYQTNINNIFSIYLKDIETGSIQLQYVGNASYWYYCLCYGYLGNERIFTISKYDLNQYEFTQTYIYRSGVEIVNMNSDEPYTNFSLAQNFPNPFLPQNSNTTISFSLDKQGFVSMAIYNIKGQKVKELLSNDNLVQGNHSLVWDGRDDNNKILASGTYFYKLAVNGIEEYKKVLVLK
jgi:hypothetical protein